MLRRGAAIVVFSLGSAYVLALQSIFPQPTDNMAHPLTASIGKIADGLAMTSNQSVWKETTTLSELKPQE